MGASRGNGFEHLAAHESVVHGLVQQRARQRLAGLRAVAQHRMVARSGRPECLPNEPVDRSLDERLTPNVELKPAASQSSLVVFINECAAA